MKEASALIALALVVLLTGGIGQGTNEAALVAAIVFFPAALCLYVSPAIIAWRREHLRVTAIAILNLCLGWTMLGWVAALIWAYAPPIRASDIARASRAEAPPDTKVCPYCAETIREAAVRCHFCGADL